MKNVLNIKSLWAEILSQLIYINIDDLQNLALDNQQNHKVKVFHLLVYLSQLHVFLLAFCS